MEKIELEAGEIICDKCKGTGTIKQDPYSFNITCNKCYGSGKLTWIENVLGKDNPYSGYGTTGYSGTCGLSGTSGSSGVSGYYGTSGSSGYAIIGAGGGGSRGSGNIRVNSNGNLCGGGHLSDGYIIINDNKQLPIQINHFFKSVKSIIEKGFSLLL